MKRFLSLGAGVQSSTLALIIARGELEPIDAAIFADTGWEPPKVYVWLDWLTAEIQRCAFPFAVHRVRTGNIRDDIIRKSGTNATGQTFRSIPWHLLKPSGETAINKRQCTSAYKIEPIHKKLRELLGYAPRQRIPKDACELLLGISLDEIYRMKTSRHGWLVHAWPLIDLSMTRNDCLLWMERKGYPLPPRSSCVGCPYHSDDEWRSIREDPELWADAVMIDKLIRKPRENFQSEQFMHRSCVPLDEVDLSTAADHGQLDFFNEECDGMCGV